MPGLDGFDVLAALPSTQAPAVIFTTAYDEYAVRAFDVNAVDYLLKPFARDRFLAALRRARAAIDGRASVDPRLSVMLEALWAARVRPDRLLVKDAGRIYFVRLDEVDWIEAAGNYARVHAGSSAHLVRETMASLGARLDPRRFVRIHRSAIVNVDRIREIQPWFRGDHIVILRDGRRLTLSRTYRDAAHAVWGDAL
jgi:two-component system LytT family response regulator